MGLGDQSGKQVGNAKKNDKWFKKYRTVANYFAKEAKGDNGAERFAGKTMVNESVVVERKRSKNPFEAPVIILKIKGTDVQVGKRYWIEYKPGAEPEMIEGKCTWIDEKGGYFAIAEVKMDSRQLRVKYVERIKEI